MKKYIKILLVIPFLYACSSNTDVIQQDNNTKVYANYTKCLNGIGVMKVETDSVPMTIIEWTYNNNILSIQHKNAGFNCCFDGILISVNSIDDVIEIAEKEYGDPCFCNCPRDIDFIVKEIPVGKYQIKIKEALDISDFEPIVFSADLFNGNNGTIKFERPAYPWMIIE